MQYVNVKVLDAVATITMDRTKKCNALNPQLMEDLQTAFSDVHQEKRVKAVVLTGAGDHFCSGIDLSTLSEISRLPQHESVAEWFSIWQKLNQLFENLLRFPKVIVAAVDGCAEGAGFGLALASDIIVVSKRAKLSANAVRHGLVGGSTTALLAYRCGAAVAARLALTGEAIDAEEAHRLGACSAPVPESQIWVEATRLAQKASSGPQEAIQANKRMLNESIGEQVLSQLAAGSASSATACTTESAVEGIRAFVEKRVADWP